MKIDIIRMFYHLQCMDRYSLVHSSELYCRAPLLMISAYYVYIPL